MNGTAGRMGRGFDQAGVAARVGAEGPDPADASGSRMGHQAREMGIVPVEDGGARRVHAFEDLGLGVGDPVDAVEKLQMDGRDRGDDRHLRLGHAGQRPDLAGVVHPQLEDTVVGVGGQARQAERDAQMVVEIAGRRGGRALAGQGHAQRLLGPGLADRAGDRGDPGPAAQAAEPPKGLQGRKGIGDLDHRRIGCQSRRPLVDDGGGGAGIECLGDVVVTVVVGTGQGDEQVARFQRTAVDDHTGRRPVTDGLAVGRGRDLFCGPQGRRCRHGAPPSNSATARTASSASSKGRISSPTICPCSCPLPAMTRMSPG